jgi:hypothetical protein
LGSDSGRRSSVTGLPRPARLRVLLADEGTHVLGDVCRLVIGRGVLLELAPVAQFVRPPRPSQLSHGVVIKCFLGKHKK